MHNVSVSGIVWIGSVPSATDLDLAQRRGIERVIDLSAGDARPRYDLSAACERLGLTCVEIGLRAKDEIPDDAVDCVVRLLGQDDAPKTLLFCEDGSTAALFLAIHRVVTEGVSLERALLEARRCGMASGPPEELVRTHVARLSRDR